MTKNYTQTMLEDIQFLIENINWTEADYPEDYSRLLQINNKYRNQDTESLKLER
jgi:hypothetical protein